MWSVTKAVAVSAYHGVPGLDVCPPVQEDLGDPEVASLSSTVEGSPSILSDTQRDNTSQIHGLYTSHKLTLIYDKFT